MSILREELREYSLKKPASVEEFPFGPEAAVFKVMGKMFALIPVDVDPPSISLKCDPAFAEILRENYTHITPGYHLNKRHWNTVVMDESIPDGLVWEMIDNSYKLVAKGLKKADRDKLANISLNTEQKDS